MAVSDLTSTSLSSGTGGSSIHEDLLDMFTNEDRAETPLVSMIGSSKAQNVNHEWLIDNYADPVANSAAEGRDFVAGDADQVARRRLGNYTQIFRKTLSVSGTAQAVDTAGVANEFAHQIKKKVVEMRRDIERQAVLYWPSSAVNPTGAQAAAVVKDGTDGGGAGLADGRHFGSIFSFTGTNYLASATAPGAVTTGLTQYAAAGGAGVTTNFTDAAGDKFYGDAAANVDLTSAQLANAVNTLMEGMYLEGGKPNVVFTGTTLKVALSRAFTTGGGGGAGVASQRNIDSMAKKLNIAITSVMTDFGFDLALIPSYIMQSHANASNLMLAVDTSMVKRAVLRPINTNKLDDGGDGKRALILCEETLRIDNPQSIGAIYNIGTVT